MDTDKNRCQKLIFKNAAENPIDTENIKIIIVRLILIFQDISI
jgi:hypothetical protein